MIDREGLQRMRAAANEQLRRVGMRTEDLVRWRQDAHPEKVIALLDHIAELEAARDEACFLAEQWMSDDWRDSSAAHEHLAQLRTVGSKEGV